jgi:heptosyltransferase-3
LPVPAPDRILLIQLGDIGDVVLTTPALKALHRQFPDCEISVAVREKAAGLLEEQPWVSRVITVAKSRDKWHRTLAGHCSFFLNLRRNHFDVAVDLRTGSRGTILTALSGARYKIGRLPAEGSFFRRILFSHTIRPSPEIELAEYAAQHNMNILAPLLVDETEAPAPELVVNPACIEEAQALMRVAGVPEEATIVAVHPFTLWKYKEWGTEKWKQVIKHLREKHRASVVVTGAPEDRSRAAELAGAFQEGVFNLAGKSPLGILPAVLRRCRLVVCVDTATLHIAAAVGTPTVGIFGPSRTAVWAPRGPSHIAAVKCLDCVPCGRKGCEDTGRSRCLDELGEGEVAALVDICLKS